jgi:hypothetical protein
MEVDHCDHVERTLQEQLQTAAGVSLIFSSFKVLAILKQQIVNLKLTFAIYKK